MPLFTNPYGKKRILIGMKDDSITPSQQVQKILAQTGSIKDVARDAGRKALPPGKRISKTGNVYWESRKSRSDIPESNL